MVGTSNLGSWMAIEYIYIYRYKILVPRARFTKPDLKL